MKKLLPLLLIASAPAYADITHSITSSIKLESITAATTADKIGSSFSVSGQGVSTEDSASNANVVGGFGEITNGVPEFVTITASQAESGEAFSFSQSFLEGDATPTSAVTTGEVANFSDLTSTAAGDPTGLTGTIDNHTMEVDLGTSTGTIVTGQFVTTLTVD